MQTTGLTSGANLDTESIDGLGRFLPPEEGASGYGAAAYISPDTIICRLYDLQTGELLSYLSAAGSYATLGGKELKEALTDILEELAIAGGTTLSKLNVAAVSGTTAMESKAAGVDQQELVHDDDEGSDNFGCDVEYMFAGATSIAVGEAFYVPCLGAEIGGDFLCSLLAIDILGSEEPVLFISAGSEGGSAALIAFGNREAVSISVLPEGADVQEGLRQLLELCNAEYDHISRALVAGDVAFAVPEELVAHLSRIEYPAIVGTSAVLLSEDAEDELCSIVSGCRVVSL